MHSRAGALLARAARMKIQNSRRPGPTVTTIIADPAIFNLQQVRLLSGGKSVVRHIGGFSVRHFHAPGLFHFVKPFDPFRLCSFDIDHASFST